jgi:aminoglycoside 3-N-acetyltransferase
MISYRELANAFRSLKIPTHEPVLAHVSLPAFGEVKGGAETMLAALLATVDDVMMPAFTWQTMVIPRNGPTHNAILYSTADDARDSAEFFDVTLPAHPEMGETAEALRNSPQARRSQHPILSFTGVGVDMALEKQTLLEPYAPIHVLSELQGWVLLVGVDQTRNFSLHWVEGLSGRKQFIRWALFEDRVQECPHFPGCANGFNAADKFLQPFTRETEISGGLIRAIPLPALLEETVKKLKQDPLALLCSAPDCDFCSIVRQQVETRSHWITLR